MKPRDVVLAAVAHRATDVLPYRLAVDAKVKEKLNAHYGGAERFPAHERFFASTGYANWRPDNVRPGDRFRDTFGTLWEQGNIFRIVEPALKSPSLKGFEFPTLVKDEQVPALADWCRKRPDRFRSYNAGLLFFERAWALRGMENLLMDMAAEPAFCHELLERLMELHLEALEKILSLPFDAVRFADDYGSQKGLIMGLPYWRKYLKPRLARMYGAVRDAGKIVMIHSCGDNSQILGEMIDMGLQIFNPAQPEANELAALKKQYGRHLTFDGGIGTQRSLPFGTPADVREEIVRCRETLGAGGGYIMGTAKPIRPDVPVENAVACVETIIEQAHLGTPT